MYSAESHGEDIGDETLIFDPKNRADKIAIILFGDYGNAMLPLTPLHLKGRKVDVTTLSPVKSFLEFYGVGGPNAWVLKSVGGDLQAEDLIHHPYSSLIGEIDDLVRVLNVHLERYSLEEASQVAFQIMQLLKSHKPQYSIKHSSEC